MKCRKTESSRVLRELEQLTIKEIKLILDLRDRCLSPRATEQILNQLDDIEGRKRKLNR